MISIENMLILNQQKIFLSVGGILAFIAVAAGAFGAHMLKEKLSPSSLNIFEIGVKYQFYHALGLMVIGLTYAMFPSLSLKLAGYLLILGVIVFSGSLYMLALTDVKLWGAVTPIGGIFLLLSWTAFVIAVIWS